MRTFEDVWRDIQSTLRAGQHVKTLCQKVKNEIVEVNPDGIKVRSERTGAIRTVTKEDFEHVWATLSDLEEFHGLRSVNRIIGRRAIACAIMSRLPYVDGECVQGMVRLGIKR